MTTMFVCLALFSLLLHDASSLRCGIRNKDESVNLRIIGGTDAEDGRETPDMCNLISSIKHFGDDIHVDVAISGAWPWLVALASRAVDEDTSEMRPYFKCGGSLITHRHVLTAAHCYEKELYLARLGTNNLLVSSPPALDVLIEEFFIHDDFDFVHAYNDIGNIRPICLPKEKFFIKKSYDNILPIVAGWGDINYGAETGTDILKETELPIFNFKECQEIYKKFKANVTSENICVGYKTGGKDACQGDSGGPLMLKVPKRKSYFVIGIVSHGLKCGLKGVPGIFTKVSSYIPWIKKIIMNTTKDTLLQRIRINRKKKKSEIIKKIQFYFKIL